ncbi:UPF0261 domain-containing protein/TIM-br_sig_trns domain-containing protein [Cucumis melo var. makuwa]|uniref:UPF0261 domain-containing protein/TIM-br_sig_trns domain-containing protein n=1 Tax=Cucumis melo var. makuwa TaxID=1194695 RepID=A0A5D3BNY0_CUCMM|nr:UPF0261 domain-containing protein/TIM-br_sig_trns domain-containing protein [Cucumis melo var. makuwa]
MASKREGLAIGIDLEPRTLASVCGSRIELRSLPTIRRWWHNQGYIDENNTVIDYNGLLNIHMLAYYNSIFKGVATVMVSYSSWNGVRMHANCDLVTGFLKNKLKFKGFVIFDWQGIERSFVIRFCIILANFTSSADGVGVYNQLMQESISILHKKEKALQEENMQLANKFNLSANGNITYSLSDFPEARPSYYQYHLLDLLVTRTILGNLKAQIHKEVPIIGAGAGTEISAKFEEDGGVDLIVVYNSGRFRMAGRGSLAGLLPFADANAIMLEMANEVLPSSIVIDPVEVEILNVEN